MEVLEQTLDSREVAKMIDMRHDNLLQKINIYIRHLGKDAVLKNKVGEYFISSQYFDDNSQLRPCFQISKKGCDMIANKLSGEKGVLFTARYIEVFTSMETHIKEQESLPVTPREQLKLMYEFQEDTAKRVDDVSERVTDLEENTKIDASDYGYIGRRINQRVKEIAKGYNLTNREQKSKLYQDINTGVKQITGVSTRSQLRQKDFDKVNDYINNWQPSTATITIIKDMRDSA